MYDCNMQNQFCFYHKINAYYSMINSSNTEKYNLNCSFRGNFQATKFAVGPPQKKCTTKIVFLFRFCKFGLGISAMALFFRSTARAAAVCQKLAAPSANAAVNSLSHQKVFISHGLGPWVRVYTFCMYLITISNDNTYQLNVMLVGV